MAESDIEEQFHDSLAGEDARISTNASRPNFSRIEFPKLTDTHSIEYWFIRLESWFRLQNISDEVVRFEAVVASLTPQLFDQVVDFIIAPPAVEPYKRLKAAIIEKFTDSEYTRVDKLLSTVPLGAQRPSHLLAEIRRAGATRDENILRVCWLRRLPMTIRAILSTSKVPLSELAVMADATYDTLQSEGISLSQVASGSFSSNQMGVAPLQPINPQNDLVKCIEALTLQINELRNEKSNRGRSQNRSVRVRSNNRNQNRDQTPAANRTPTCWFHRNFGTQARRCLSPCDFTSSPPTAART